MKASTKDQKRPRAEDQKPLKVKDQRQTKQKPPMKDQRPQTEPNYQRPLKAVRRPLEEKYPFFGR